MTNGMGEQHDDDGPQHDGLRKLESRPHGPEVLRGPSGLRHDLTGLNVRVGARGAPTITRPCVGRCFPWPGVGRFATTLGD